MKMAGVSMEMTPGAIPRPGGVPEQRLLSPESWLRDGGGSGTFLVSWLIGLEVLGHEGLNRRRVGVRGVLGGPHSRGAPPLGRAALWGGAPWLPSGPSSVLWKLPGKIRYWALISSNSENISFVGFLKPKTAENSN